MKLVQKVQISYEYIYLHLAVDGVRGKIEWIWAENMKQSSVEEAVKSWLKRGIEVLLWDGAPSHRGNEVKALGMSLITQPAYTPELNPAERVFEAIRGEVEGKVYATLADKQESVEEFLEQLAASPDRIKRLAGWSWIREALHSLPAS